MNAEKETRYIQYGQTGHNNVSNLYNNSVVEKIYGMAYIFTLLMFRKSNKTTINTTDEYVNFENLFSQYKNN
jgi:hypothetical protein